MRQTAAALLFVLAGALPLAAQQPLPPASSVMPPGYLQAMPTVDRVLADMKVADSVETRARQYTAVSYLHRRILFILTEDHLRSGLTPEESRLERGYLDAENQLLSGSARVPGLRALMNRYRAEVRVKDPSFHDQLLDRYFSPALKAAFLTLERARAAREAAAIGERDSIPTADGVAAAADSVAARAVHGAPVPPDQRRFAVAINGWCRRFLAPEQTNPIAREQFQREARRQAADISRSVGLVRSWSGVLLGIESYTPVFKVRGEAASAANLVVSVDTAATVIEAARKSIEAVGPYYPPAAFKTTVGSSSPIYAAAGRMGEGQRVVFSGRALQFDSWVAGGVPARCTAMFKIVLTDLRPGP